jgi:hypothetical protein
MIKLCALKRTGPPNKMKDLQKSNLDFVEQSKGHHRKQEHQKEISKKQPKKQPKSTKAVNNKKG